MTEVVPTATNAPPGSAPPPVAAHSQHVEETRSPWTAGDMEKIVLWLEDPVNLARTKGRTRETKSTWMRDLALLFPTRSFKQVYDKFDNYKKAWKEAHNWNKQPGWGVTEENMGNADVRRKLLKKCPFFLRLEKLFADRPNVDPPAQFDSGDNSASTNTLMEQVSKALATEDPEEAEVISSDEESEPGEEDLDGTDDGVTRPSTRSARAPMTPRSLTTKRPNAVSTTKPSALKKGTKRNIPENLVLDSEDDGSDRPKSKRKRTQGASSALADAVTAFLEIRSQREDKRFSFMEKQLEQQGELRRKELEDERALRSREMDLNERKLALEERKVANEERRLELLTLQLRNGNVSQGNNVI
ncbi:hypothetical protein RUND412_005906 [Rhizina undulata]